MNSRSSSSTAFLYSFVGPVLLTAVLASGCNGSGAGTPISKGSGGTATNSGGTATNSGGTTTNSGGTTSSSGGTTSSSGGTTSSSGGITSSEGGTTTSAGGTTARSGGATTGSGGITTGTGGTTTSAGGTTARSGGTTTGTGGTTTNAGGATTSSGGTSARTGGTTPAGGATTGSGGAASGGSTSTSTTPGWPAPVAGGPSGTGGTTATVTVNPGTTVGTIGADYTGFSYEKTHIMNGSLTTNNTNMIALYKLLGAPMMRMCANDVERCAWAGTGTAPSQPNGQPFNTKVTTGGVDQLCGFLAATGSKAIYGVNFQLGDVAASTAEATYVMSKCPQSIVGFEIGNEPDKFGTVAAQQAEHQKFADSILAIPGTLLVGPGSTSGGAASASSFTPLWADAMAPKYGSKFITLTQHSYVAGAGSTDCSLPNLQITTSKILNIFTTTQAAATKNKIPSWRMDENNTCSGHGQQGLSDTFISALWAIDYMFESAKRGASGINFHNGETGMDGTNPFFYEPIKEDKGVVVQVQPEYYGLLLFTQAGTGPMVSTTVSGGQNFTAWAIKANGFISVVLNNRHASNAVSATVNLGAAVSSASAIYLQGTPPNNLTATEGNVTLAGAKVTVAGDWPRNPPYIQAVTGNNVSVYVPAASAVLVRVLQ